MQRVGSFKNIIPFERTRPKKTSIATSQQRFSENLKEQYFYSSIDRKFPLSSNQTSSQLSISSVLKDIGTRSASQGKQVPSLFFVSNGFNAKSL